mmetsp:Transcript_4781/g.19159  ORF Transcript_4781/g.19159 Transcript_4781/m.19159 type:complete len:200 (-) Transcript_4781:701-1300(-)
MDRRSENYERGRLGPGRERARPDVHQRPPQRVPGAAPGHRLSAQRPAPRQLLAAERWPHRDSGLRPDDGNHQGAAERHDQIRVPPFVEAVRQDAGGPHSTWIPGQGAERERGEPQDRRAHHRGGAQPGQQGRRHGGLRSNGPHESRRRRSWCKWVLPRRPWMCRSLMTPLTATTTARTARPSSSTMSAQRSKRGFSRSF